MRPSRQRKDRVEAPPVSALPVPENLTAAEAAYWNKLTAHLASMGLLRATDQEALIILCQTLAQRDILKAELDKSKPLVKGSQNQLVPNPLWRMLEKTNSAASILLSRFGLTPSDREGIGRGQDAPQANPFAKLPAKK